MRYVYRFIYFPARLYWYLRRPNVYGAGVIIEQNGRILLVRHTYGDRTIWHIPGGGRKKNESSIMTAVREINEELGIEVSPKFLGSVEATEEYRRVHSTCYYTDRFNGNIRPDKKEIAEYKWWPKDGLPELNPVSRACIGKLLQS